MQEANNRINAGEDVERIVGRMSYHLGSAVKLVARGWVSPNTQQQLSKALEHIKRYRLMGESVAMPIHIESEAALSILMSGKFRSTAVIAALYRADTADCRDISNMWLSKAVGLIEARIIEEGDRDQSSPVTL